MKKLNLYLISGAILIVVGISLLTADSWFGLLNNCYLLYPPTNANGNYNYPPDYYTCERAHQIYSTFFRSFGYVTLAIGFLMTVGSITVNLVSEYKDRPRPSTVASG